jgi:hypothetical protein
MSYPSRLYFLYLTTINRHRISLIDWQFSQYETLFPLTDKLKAETSVSAFCVLGLDFGSTEKSVKNFISSR